MSSLKPDFQVATSSPLPPLPSPANAELSSVLSGTTVSALPELNDDNIDAVVSGVLGLSVAPPASSPTPSDTLTDSGTELPVVPPRTVRLIYSKRFLSHSAPQGHRHPECPERLTTIVSALRADPRLKGAVDWTEPTPTDDGSERRALVLELVRQVHTSEDYLKELQALSEGCGGSVDGDTYVAPGSYEVALLAVSAWLDAVDHSLNPEAGGPAFALTRPPGHHATRATGMGFCLLANAAIAAAYALRRESRVSIVDIDVHAGNGTDHCVRDEPRIRFASSHEMPLYPYSGSASDTGPHGTIRNVPLVAGTKIAEYLELLTSKMLTHVLHSDKSHGVDAPGLVIVSCGFDTLDADPLASIEFNPEDFEEIASTIVSATQHHAGHTNIIFGLEGGYNLGPQGIGTAASHAVCGLAGVPKS
jgi:acetoin utilization deacetylase AcuC-like enzyme